MENGLILASGSRRRQELLSKVGISYRVVEADIEETLPGDMTIGRAVVKVASDKAAWVQERFPEDWILAADTVVVLRESILQKPRDEEEAKGMLRRLSGRTHDVLTGYCLRNGSLNRTRTGVAQTRVTMRPLRDWEIERYVASGEPMDKAGAYAIQEIGAMFITRIEGSYTNVVGLPLAEVVTLLMEEGVAFPLEAKP